jgi:hypothetical protein
MNTKSTPVLIFLVAGLVSCGMRATSLGDNSTQIPKNPKAYKNRVKFNAEVLRYIDTSVVYEEIGYLNRLNKDSLIYYKQEPVPHSCAFYRFYSNGFINNFLINVDTPWTPKQFDPAYNGYRGIYYMKKGKIKTELFAPCNQLYQMGKIKFTVLVKGDTLIVGMGKSDWYPGVYVKRKLSPEYLIYKIPG